MRSLILILALTATSPAIAQDFMLSVVPPNAPLPRTVKLDDGKGNIIGTATVSGNRAVMRKTNGEFIATVVLNADGTRTIYDEHGKVLDRVDLSVPDMPATDSK